MSIGILTYHTSDNYGSVLQAYALQKHINKYTDCEVIDYRKNEVIKLYKIFKPLTCRYNILSNIYSMFFLSALLSRKRSYEDFRLTEINLSSKCYTSKDSLEYDINAYNALISGSDQVWNFDIVDFDTSYMLDFPKYRGKRFAYAASMGPKAKDASDFKKYRELIDKFDVVTVREKTALETVAKTTSKAASLVIDPVFLLDKSEWESLGHKSKIDTSDDYIFCYFPGGVSKSMEAFSKKLAKQYNSKRILVMPEWKNFFRSGKKLYDCSPWDFVKLIKNAKCVCTTSFHGTAFSLILNTEFYVEMGAGANDSRIRDILVDAGKTNCIINSEGTFNDYGFSISDRIKYSKEILAEFIKLSKESL